nr:hypothetical protein [Tanacetum cinerariifolium]
VGYGTKSLLEQRRNTYGDVEQEHDYDAYDDDMYEGQVIPDNIQTICNNLDIKVRAHKLSPTSSTKATLRKLDADVPNDVDYDIWLPLASDHKKPTCWGTCLVFGHSGDECPKILKRVVNMMDKGKGGSSGADDDGFIEAKKKISSGNNRGNKNFKLWFE